MQTEIAKLFLTTLDRNVTENDIEVINYNTQVTINKLYFQETVLNVMAKDDAKDRGKFFMCVQWAKEKISNFRTDERRKVSTCSTNHLTTGPASQHGCCAIHTDKETWQILCLQKGWLVKLLMCTLFEHSY